MVCRGGEGGRVEAGGCGARDPPAATGKAVADGLLRIIPRAAFPSRTRGVFLPFPFVVSSCKCVCTRCPHPTPSLPEPLVSTPSGLRVTVRGGFSGGWRALGSAVPRALVILLASLACSVHPGAGLVGWRCRLPLLVLLVCWEQVGPRVHDKKRIFPVSLLGSAPALGVGEIMTERDVVAEYEGGQRVTRSTSPLYHPHGLVTPPRALSSGCLLPY